MSLCCPRVQCKEQKGMCGCEKIMAVVIAAIALIALYKLFAA